jgi:hypothetical protein
MPRATLREAASHTEPFIGLSSPDFFLMHAYPPGHMGSERGVTSRCRILFGAPTGRARTIRLLYMRNTGEDVPITKASVHRWNQANRVVRPQGIDRLKKQPVTTCKSRYPGLTTMALHRATPGPCRQNAHCLRPIGTITGKTEGFPAERD